MSQIKLVVAEQNPIYRQGFHTLLEANGMKVVCLPANFAELMPKLVHRPNILLIGSDFCELREFLNIATRRRWKKIIVAKPGEEPDPFYEEMGVDGVVYYNTAAPDLVHCLRTVAKGELYVPNSPAVSGEPSVLEARDCVSESIRQLLNARQLIVTLLVTRGYKNREIGRQFGTSEQVIKNTLRDIFDKIGVGDRLELALFFIHHRLLVTAAIEAYTLAVGEGTVKKPLRIPNGRRVVLATITDTFNSLTPKAQAVLYAYCSGKAITIQQIAKLLGAQEWAIEGYLRFVFAKFGVRNLEDLGSLFNTCPRLREAADAAFAKVERKAAKAGKELWHVMPDKSPRLSLHVSLLQTTVSEPQIAFAEFAAALDELTA